MASVSKRAWTYKGQKKTAWIVRWIDSEGTHRQETFQAKKDADAYCRTVETEKNEKGQVAAFSGRSLSELAERFIRYQEDRSKDGRIGPERHDMVKRAIDRDILPHLGSKKCAEITPEDVENWYSALCRRGLQPGTAKNRVGMLSQIFNFALDRKLVAASPVPLALKRLRGIGDRKIRTFTFAEMQRLLAALETKIYNRPERSHQLVKCAVHLAAFCGLRRGEIFGLTVGDIDGDRGVIHVRHSLTPGDRLKGPKTRAGIRDVPVPKHVMAMLDLWLREHYRANDRELLFRPNNIKGKDGTGFSSAFHAAWILTQKKAGIEERDGSYIHFHALRHFAASSWIEHGIPLTDVAELLGHESFDITLQVYAHPVKDNDHRRRTFERVSDVLLPTNFSSVATIAQQPLTI